MHFALCILHFNTDCVCVDKLCERKNELISGFIGEFDNYIIIRRISFAYEKIT